MAGQGVKKEGQLALFAVGDVLPTEPQRDLGSSMQCNTKRVTGRIKRCSVDSVNPLQMVIQPWKTEPGQFVKCESVLDRGSNDASPFAAIGICTEMLVTPRRKSSIAVLSPRLEIKTARCICLRRAVSLYMPRLYCILRPLRYQFKRPHGDGHRRPSLALTQLIVMCCRVQILSPLLPILTGEGPSRPDSYRA